MSRENQLKSNQIRKLTNADILASIDYLAPDSSRDDKRYALVAICSVVAVLVVLLFWL